MYFQVIGSSILILFDNTKVGAWLIDFGKTVELEGIKIDHEKPNSSTCVDQNKNTSEWRLMKDTFKIGSVSGNVSIKVEEDRDWIALLGGTMGLSAFSSSIDNSSGLNFVDQLGKMGVNSPVSFAARNNSYNHHLTIGGLDSENCYTDWAFAPNIANYSTLYQYQRQLRYGFNGSSIDATDPKGAVIASVNSNVAIFVKRSEFQLYATDNIREIFVNASGGVWNDTIEEWTVPCNGSLSGNVVLNVNGSGRVVFTPSDYIAFKSWYIREGDDYDNNSGYYIEACIVDVGMAYSYWIEEYLHVDEFILAGYSFYRNHCLAHNYKTGEFGIATSVNNDGIKYY
ncbi:putative inositol-trisphosphate 3-kinase A isoform X1 [Ditylenchus destructor]|uniref:Inositol-trisphosphate 3-kinase A isoform X1 n=1 Tax=Ditylenchus destructor TaxID=166010 RepID=A0AAD4QUE5_9BILA|nr:putative inositol-trisphosphate 3-kinase A isoform X1 [Ditylenchus destructor]